MIKEIKNYPKYGISDNGVVTEVSTGRIIPIVENGGYLCCNIRNEKGKTLAKM